MATFTKFEPFVENLAEGKHNLGSNQLVVALTNTAPTNTFSTLSQVTEISYSNCSSRNITTSTSAQTSGTYKLTLTDLVLTATGTVGPFRYVVVYDDTSTSDNLIASYDYGSSITLANAETFTIDFDASGGFLTVA